MSKSTNAWVEKDLSFTQAMQEAVALYHDQAWWAAQNLAQQIADGWPDEPAGANLLGMIAQKTDNLARALHHFYHALQINPQYLPAYQNAGFVLANLRGALLDAQVLPLVLAIKSSQLPETTVNNMVLTLLDWLGFHREGDKVRCASVFQRLVVPLIAWASECGYFDLLLRLEMRVYQDYVKQENSEAHAAACYTPIGDSLATAGQKARQLWMRQPESPLIPHANVIGVFVHSTSLLRHVEQLLAWLEGRQALAAMGKGDGKTIAVYAFSGNDDGFCQACENLGASVVLLDTLTTAESYAERLQVLQTKLAHDGVPTLVWLSALPLLVFASHYGLVPNIIWWSFNKYHHLPWAHLHAKITSVSDGFEAWQADGWQQTILCEWSSEEADNASFVALAKQMALCMSV